MRLATRKNGQCIFCAIDSSRSLISKSLRARGRRHFAAQAGASAKEDDDSWASGTQKDSRKDGTRIFWESASSTARLPGTIQRSLGREKKGLPTQLEVRNGIKGLFGKDRNTAGMFSELVKECFDIMTDDLTTPENIRASQVWGISSGSELISKLRNFRSLVRDSCRSAEKGLVDAKTNPIYSQLREAFITGAVSKLQSQLKHAFTTSVLDTKLSEEDKEQLAQISDLRNPLDWYPEARAIQREVHLHVGPTNSGKTYHALKRLEEAETGIYAGPLRLLAHEVYTRLNAKGKTCALITGEERRVPEGMNHVMHSCTVEMVALNTRVDVAVIDEIQMLADDERGWAWTQAFLGTQATEVHVCGEIRATNLIKQLCLLTGDKLIIHNYERLSPLKTQDNSLGGDLNNLQKGDAIISFSRIGIHALKTDIEKVTGRRCAVVYGSLPPETRAQQAALFNDPDNDYDFLAASDAVGMGLNLSIKRVVFESTTKSDGVAQRLLSASAIKQIAGRAGRYKTASEAVKTDAVDLTDGHLPSQENVRPAAAKNVGYVTTLEDFDLPIVREAMDAEVEPLKTAGILAPTDVILRFARRCPPRTPFSYVNIRIQEMAKIHPLFHFCKLKNQIEVADVLEAYEMPAGDRLAFMASPAEMRNHAVPRIMNELASCVGNHRSGRLLDLQTFELDLLDQSIQDFPGGSKSYLNKVETLHKALTLYLWLSYRFAGIFQSQALAFHVKKLAEGKIDECLRQTIWDTQRWRVNARKRKRQLQTELKQKLKIDSVKLAPDALGELITSPDVNGQVEGAGVETEISAEAVPSADIAKKTELNTENEDVDTKDIEEEEEEEERTAESTIPMLPESVTSKGHSIVIPRAD